MGKLSVARAFGDKWMLGVSARPKITKHEFTAGDNNVLILGCDGLFDVLSTNSVLQYSQNKTCKQIAESLPGIALQCNSSDNISVMAIKFKSLKKHEE